MQICIDEEINIHRQCPDTEHNQFNFSILYIRLLSFLAFSFGGAIAFGAYQISTADNHMVMLIGSGLLTGVMGFRLYNSHKFMPAGLFC